MTSNAIPLGFSNPVVTMSCTLVPSRFAHWILPSPVAAQYIFPPATSNAIPPVPANPVTMSCTFVPSRFARRILPAFGTPQPLISAQYICVPLVSIAEISSSERVNSHSRTVPSPLPLANMLPSGLNATLLTQDVCPVSVSIDCPVTASHSRTVLSSLPLASMAPSGLKATLLISAVCPMSVAVDCPVLMSHRRTV